MSYEEKEVIRIQFQNALETLVNSKLRPTATAIAAAEMPITILFEELINTIDKLQKENEHRKEVLINTLKENEQLSFDIDDKIKIIDKLRKENQELKEKNTILEGNKIGYKLAIQELKEKIREYEIGIVKE